MSWIRRRLVNWLREDVREVAFIAMVQQNGDQTANLQRGFAAIADEMRMARSQRDLLLDKLEAIAGALRDMRFTQEFPP